MPILEALRLETGVPRALESHWGVTSLIAASGFIVFSSLICCDFESILDIVQGRKRGREEDEEEREVSWRSSVLVNFYSWGSLKPLYRDAVES